MKIRIYNKMIHLFQIKTYLLLLIFCCGVFSDDVDILMIIQPSLNASPFKMSFRRIQSYRSIVLSASGRADFDSNETIVVTYHRPIKYSVSYSDTATIAISKDAKKYANSGFRDAVEYDPFQALMMLCFAQKQNVRYIGAFDSIWIYEVELYNKKCRFSINRTAQLVREIACVNASGAVYERMLFYYKKDPRMPSSAVVLRSKGGELVRDSLILF